MPTFWEQFKKPFVTAGEKIKEVGKAVGQEVGSWFARAEAPTPEGYKPFKAEPLETMAQFFGAGKRTSALRETIEKPREAFETYLTQAQQKRLEKQLEVGKEPSPFVRYFGEELGKEIGVTTIEIAKNLAKAPFKIVKTFVYHPIYHKEKEPEWKLPGLGEITSFSQDAIKRQQELLDQGIDETTATIATILGVGSEAILDVAIVASWLESGARALARKATPQLQERIAAWKLMGEPKNPTVLKKNFDQLAHQFHPDKFGGTEAGFKILNNANQILTKGGIPTAKELLTAKAARIGQKAISPISKIMELPTPPKTLPFKLLPERAGYVPTEPFKPYYEPAVGLSVKKVPLKPVTAPAAAKEGVKQIVKYELPSQYMPALGKPTWKHGKMLWNTLRNSYGETNKFAIDLTKNKGVATWVIDRLSGGTKKLAPLMKKYEGTAMSNKQYKKMYAMFKGRDYDLEGYKHVMANLKGIEPMITEITPAKTMAEVMKPEIKPEIPREIAEAPPMKSMKELLVERAEAPPAKPPKPPTPTRVSPSPEEPEGFKITPRRMREINKAGVSPEEFAPALQAQKRGVMPFPDIIEKSQKIITSIDKIATLKPGTIKTAESVEAYRETVNGFKNDVDKLKQNWLANPQDTKAKELFDSARAKLNKAIVNIEAVRSEMARGLSAARIEDEISRAGNNLNKIREQLSPEKQLVFDKRIEAISLEDPAEVIKLITEFSSAGIIRKVLEYYKASLLSAPITHIRNTTGNTIYTLFDIPVRALAGGLDAVKSIAGTPRTVYSTEAIRMIGSGAKAVPEATTEALKALRDEFYQYGKRRITLEVGARAPAIKGKIGEIIRFPYRALSAMDVFARTIKTGIETDALAYRLAKQEGKKGAELIERIAEIKLNPPSGMIDMVTRRTERALFLEEMNGVLKGIESLKNRYPALQFIVPFYRTPVNLVREAYRMTPLRLAGAKKDPWLLEQSTKMEEISRMILGSLIGGTIVWKMIDGSIEITGAAPRKSSERDLFYRQGKQPYAIKIGDKWYSYREIHPFSEIAFGAHQIGEMIKLYKEKAEIDEKKIADQVDRIITDTSQYIQDQTFFQGLANFVEAISGGTYNQGVLTVGKNYLAQLFGGFIPNLLYSYQRAADPTIYSTEGFAEQIKKRIPGLQEGLIPKRSVFGIPSERTGGFLIQFLSPVKVSEEKRDLVDTELEKLETAIGYPQRSAFGQPLTNYEYDAYLQDSGHRIYEQLWALMMGSEYQTASEYEKEKMISKIATTAREQSRFTLFADKKRLADVKKQFEAQGYPEDQAQRMAEEEIKKPPAMGQLFPGKQAGTLEDLRAMAR